MSVPSLSQLVDFARDEAADGVAWLTGRTAGLLDDTAEVLADVSDAAALTAGRYASQACGWLSDQVLDFGERMTTRADD